MKDLYIKKTEVNKMRRAELLEMLYEQDKFYYENANGSVKDWGKKNSFEDYCERHKVYTVKELREKVVTL